MNESKTWKAWDIAWAIGGIVAGIGVSMIVGGACLPVIARTPGKLARGVMTIGGSAAGGILGYKAMEGTIEEGEAMKEIIVNGKKVWAIYRTRKAAEKAYE